MKRLPSTFGVAVRSGEPPSDAVLPAGHAQSLREITGGLAASEGKLRHLRVSEPPSRSTLSYATEHQPRQLYQSVFHDLLAQCQREAAGHKRKFRFKHKLLSIDSTTIALSLSMFDWAH